LKVPRLRRPNRSLRKQSQVPALLSSTRRNSGVSSSGIGVNVGVSTLRCALVVGADPNNSDNPRRRTSLKRPSSTVQSEHDPLTSKTIENRSGPRMVGARETDVVGETDGASLVALEVASGTLVLCRIRALSTCVARRRRALVAPSATPVPPADAVPEATRTKETFATSRNKESQTPSEIALYVSKKMAPRPTFSSSSTRLAYPNISSSANMVKGLLTGHAGLQLVVSLLRKLE
jgi:hypothetical protein